MEKVTLYRPNDLHSEYLSPDGAMWVYSIANFGEPEIPCDICGESLYDGWRCLDGGELICADHVEIVPAWIGDKLAAEFNERISLHNRLVSMRIQVGHGAIKSLNAEYKPNHYLGWVQPSA